MTEQLSDSQERLCSVEFHKYIICRKTNYLIENKLMHLLNGRIIIMSIKGTNLEDNSGFWYFGHRFVQIKHYNRDESNMPDIFLGKFSLMCFYFHSHSKEEQDNKSSSFCESKF